DVVRHQRAFHEGVARADAVAVVDAEVLAVRHEVFALNAALVLDDNRPLTAALLVEELDAAVDLGDDRRLLRPPGFEELGDARETTGDVLGAAHFARGLGQQGTGGDRLPLLDFDTGTFRDVVVGEDVPLGVLDQDLRVQVALVLHDRAPGVTGGVDL